MAEARNSSEVLQKLVQVKGIREGVSTLISANVIAKQTPSVDQMLYLLFLIGFENALSWALGGGDTVGDVTEIINDVIDIERSAHA